MTALFDAHAGLDSRLHRLDPRAKIAGLVGALFITASTPTGSFLSFACYFLLIALLAALSRLPPRYLLLRCLAASPFVVMAGLLPAVSALINAWTSGEWGEFAPGAWQNLASRGGSVLARAYAAVLLLTLLTGVTRFHHLLWGLRRLHFPHVINLISTMMYRHLYLLWEEWRRSDRARKCRAPVLRRDLRTGTYSKQIATVFVRAWERAERVHAAMTARGFTGQLPVLTTWSFGLAESFFVGVTLAAFLAARLAG